MSLAVFLAWRGRTSFGKLFCQSTSKCLGASAAGLACSEPLAIFSTRVYQYPGGWLSDRIGSRNAPPSCLRRWLERATLVYAFSPSWPFVFVGLVFAMAWGEHGLTGDVRYDRRASAA